MVARTSRGFWKWSLVAACVAWGISYALSRTDITRLFTQTSIYYFISSTDSPAAILSKTLRYTNWAWMAFEMLVAILIYFIVGWWAAQRTRQSTIGIKVGLWSGLFSGLLAFIDNSIRYFWFIHAMVLVPTAANQQYLGNQQISIAITIMFLTSFGLSFLLSFLIGIFAGLIGGTLGGLLGVRFSALSPSQTEQQEKGV